MYMSRLLCFVVFAICFVSLQGYSIGDVTNGLDRNGTNVCSYKDQASKKVQISFEQTTLVYVVVQKCCSYWCWSMCNTTRPMTKKVISYRMVTRYFDRNVYHCCSGWSRLTQTDKKCDIPKCGVSCQNGGTCVGPDQCSCPKGFSGKYCTLDEDECKDARKNNCEQYCINMLGGFRCGCRRGFNLNPDKQTCSDIDECHRPNPSCGCKDSMDTHCKSTCVNTPGSYQCKCNPGYQLNSAEKCEDINECFINSKLCDQNCINTAGSYRCGCGKGFVYDGKKCQDIDECSVSNGGCSDKCHNLQGTYVCSCPDGFYLTADKKTCKVIEPSMKNKIICESESLGFLDCDKYDEKILIIDAMYGRLTKDHCQHNNYTQNVRCKADNPAQFLTTCHNKSSCVFFFNPQVFGDPCPGIEKYMQITYKCSK